MLKQLQTLQSSKATGLDNINSRLLKDAAAVVAQPLTDIMNQSLRTGIIPVSWKKARVTPIYKDSNPLSPSNYRPISILPVVMKVFERAVQQQLVKFLKENSIFCDQQSGFRECHSTHTATTDVSDYILQNMDRGLLTGAVYLDLKKAFDTVDFQTLLFKLRCLGITDVEYTWFENYLYDRRQCVSHNSSRSDELGVSCGVPQGSILGPILFVIFVNDFPSAIQYSKVVLYADDTVLMFASTSIQEIQDCLSSDLQFASGWFRQNKLHLNVSKCKWTLFGTEKRLKTCEVPDIKIDSNSLEHVSTYKYLGLYFDKNLNWQVQVESMCNKLKQRLGVLRRVRCYLDRNTTLLLFNALVQPVADYCDTVYGSCSKTLLNKIQRLLCKGGRIILNAPLDTPSRTVLHELKWLSLNERIFFHRCILVYKSLHGQCPSYVANKFQHLTHGYNTRNSQNLELLKCRTNLGQKTLTYTGAKEWNSLPQNVKTSSSLAIFKSNLLKCILSRRSSQYFIPF